jgi:hypothetical protein
MMVTGFGQDWQSSLIGIVSQPGGHRDNSGRSPEVKKSYGQRAKEKVESILYRVTDGFPAPGPHPGITLRS